MFNLSVVNRMSHKVINSTLCGDGKIKVGRYTFVVTYVIIDNEHHVTVYNEKYTATCIGEYFTTTIANAIACIELQIVGYYSLQALTMVNSLNTVQGRHYDITYDLLGNK